MTGKRGRPLKPEDQKRGKTTGFRFPPNLRETLEDYAARNDRSLSQEVQSRLERSVYEDRELAAPGAAAMLHALRRVALILGNHNAMDWDQGFLEYQPFHIAVAALIEKAAPQATGKWAKWQKDWVAAEEDKTAALEALANVDPANMEATTALNLLVNLKEAHAKVHALTKELNEAVIAHTSGGRGAPGDDPQTIFGDWIASGIIRNTPKEATTKLFTQRED